MISLRVEMLSFEASDSVTAMMMMETAREPGPTGQLYSGPIAWWRCVLKALWGPFQGAVILAGFGFITASSIGLPK